MSDRLAVIVPMKPLTLAKQRLRPALDEAARVALARRMLEHVLATVQASGVADLALLISADAGVRDLAQAFGFRPLAESTLDAAPVGYNEAVRQAIRWARGQGATTALVLPADLPHLAPADLQRLVALAGTAPRTVVIAPNADDTGTNALLLRPPDLFAPAFGPDSFRRHLALAR
ncbi:MAG: 2-phospho-L-lactate guanylyltransferase, partial [Anaerolineae bacterium]|nr:2-phospho-L-lactate guanylyltransferase [Anaerolineae bacterium]